MPAQAEIRQARGDGEEEHPQKTRLSLLQRLANVGLGRRDEESEPPIAARASGPAPSMPPLPDRRQARSVAQQIAANEPERCVLVDATEEPLKVASNIWSALRDRFFAANAGNTAAIA